jgi:hypothetical protein
VPLSEPFTAKVFVRKFWDQDMTEKEAFRLADEPSKDEVGQDKALAEELLRILGVPRDNASARSDLMIVLREARLEYNVRRNKRPDRLLPVIGGVQPTRGEVRASLKAGLRHMRKLREALPPTLLPNETVPFAEGDIILGVVIEQLTETLAHLNKKYETIETVDHFNKKYNGRPPGSRAVAQSAARYLVRFMRKHAQEARAATRKVFLFEAASALAITCPHPNTDPGAFNKWFHEVEALESIRPKPPNWSK